MEAYELQNMELGTESALYRFFTQHVVTPAVAAINAMDKVYEDSSNAKLVGGVSSGGLYSGSDGRGGLGQRGYW